MNKQASFDYKAGWAVNMSAPKNHPDHKETYLDNGTERPDPARYYDAGFMKAEWDKVWTQVWTLACPVSDVREPGDFYVYDLGQESIIITRTSQNEIKAFYNVCPHRGNRLLRDDFGSVNQFTCAFHAWSFDLDGKSTTITDKEMFRKEVLCHEHDLTSVRCEVVAGLVFVSMNPDVMPIDQWLGPIRDKLELYDIGKMVAVRHVRSEWAANWKTAVDAFYELYHLHVVHPETQAVMEDYYAQYDLYANGMSRMIVPFGAPSKRFPDQVTVNEGTKMMLRDAGLDPDTYTGTAEQAREAIQKGKRARAKTQGLDWSRFSDAQLSDSFPYGIFPNVQIGAHPEAAFIMKFLPHPTDPERFYYDTITMYLPVEGASAPMWMGLPESTDLSGAVRPDIEHIPVHEKPDLGMVLNQDADLLPVVQKGIHSKGFKGPLWSEQEVRLRHFHTELDRYIAGQK